MSLGSSQFYTVHKILSSVFHQVSENSDFADKWPHSNENRRTAEAIKGLSLKCSDISYEIDNLMYSGCLSISDKPMPLLSLEFYRLMEAT